MVLLIFIVLMTYDLGRMNPVQPTVIYVNTPVIAEVVKAPVAPE